MSKTLVDQIRAVLERQQKEIKVPNFVRQDTYSGEFFNDDVQAGIYKNDIKAGADSRTNMICKLVAALEEVAYRQLGSYHGKSEAAKDALVDLKKELGIE